MNLPRLPPCAVRHDKLDRPRILADEIPVKFDSISAGKKEQRPIAMRQNITQVERVPAFTAHAQLTIDQRSERQQTGIATARQLTMMND